MSDRVPGATHARGAHGRHPSGDGRGRQRARSGHGRVRGRPARDALRSGAPGADVALDPPGCGGPRAHRRRVAVGRVDEGGVRGLDGNGPGAVGRRSPGVDLIAPSVAGQEWARAWRGRVQLHSDTPPAPRRSCGWPSTSTCATSRRAINVPTLIVHAVEDQVCHVENARCLARTIPRARYVELPGNEHVPWFDPDDTLAEIREFLTGTRRQRRPDRVLATVLFTDLVGSTERAAELGDRRWRDLLEQHHASVRRELRRFDGVEVDTAGDGFFATFDGAGAGDPLRAGDRRRGAPARSRGPSRPAYRARSSGPTARSPGSPSTSAHASPGRRGAGEVLVSGTVRDLVAGSGLEFEDRGATALKGIPGEWRLFAVVPSARSLPARA